MYLNLPNEFYIMAKDVLPMIIIFSVVLSTIRLTYIIEKHEKFVLYKEFFSLVTVVYILVLFGLVTNTDVHSYSNNFIPFKEIFRYKISSNHFIWNVYGNIALFIPFGYFISSYLNSQKLNKPLFISLVTSTTIEVVQAFIGRSFDIDDIILNCTGGIIGFLLYVALSAVRKHLPKILQTDLFYNLLTLLLIIFIIGYVVKCGGIRI